MISHLKNSAFNLPDEQGKAGVPFRHDKRVCNKSKKRQPGRSGYTGNPGTVN